MGDQPLDVTDPPLTRRELRRREEVARAPQPAPEAIPEQPPPPAPIPAAAPFPGPRSSPSGRVPQWAIDEAAGRPVQDTAWRSPSRPLYDWQATRDVPAAAAYVPPAVRRRSPAKRFFRALGRAIGDFFGGLWNLIKFLILSAIFTAAIWNALTYLAPGFTSETGRLLASHGISSPALNPVAPPYSGAKPQGAGSADGKAPPSGVEESDHHLGTPAPVPGSSNSYAFMGKGTDQPFISYDPCRPIHYVVRPTNAPADSAKIIAEAVSSVSRATGFVFINDGPTDEAPSTDRPAYQPQRYGNRWAPVLFAWETQAEQPMFTDNLIPGSKTTLGLGGSMAVTVDGKDAAYVTGQVRLNAAALGTMSYGTDGYATVAAAVKHELGHVVGLDHVADPTQLMAPSMSGQVHDFGSGDLTGLAMLGNGKCRPNV
ncbi:hypothetical protein GCM10023063_19150 [Arthrobacter methylotrophus]|uniref:Matrixin family metalloprotease n=1 Tax=Arthrobacter methylotrophus TaxID=121291 RepID=A0ABV5UR46_9MICC